MKQCANSAQALGAGAHAEHADLGAGVDVGDQVEDFQLLRPVEGEERYFVYTDAELKKTAVHTLRGLPGSILSPVVKDSSLPSQLLELLARVRITDAELMGAVVTHPAIASKTLLYLANKAGQDVLECLAGKQNILRDHPEIVEAMIANPNVDRVLKARLGWHEPEPVPDVDPEENQEQAKANQGLPMIPGDRILICSDGLTDLVEDGEILEILQKNGSEDNHLQEMVDLANDRGGHDNITIVLLLAPSGELFAEIENEEQYPEIEE